MNIKIIIFFKKEKGMIEYFLVFFFKVRENFGLSI